MLTKLAEFTVKRPKAVLVAVLALLAVSIVFGTAVTDKLEVGGYEDPASESTAVDDFLDANFGDDSNLIFQVVPREGTIDDARVKTVVDQVRKAVESEPDSKVTRTFEDKRQADLRAENGESGLILAHVGGDETEAADRAANIIDAVPDDPDVEVKAGGRLGVQKETRAGTKETIKNAEIVALPITFVVLVIVFGGLIAAFLPIVVGISSIIATLLVLLIMTSFTDVSTHALTVATAFGLGLSIDFGLLMVSRFREELDNGKGHEQAIIATVDTAGRTIIFSAATVTLAMGGLLIFPMYFLRSVGIAASAVVVLAALMAIVVLPALLSLLGKRINALPVIKRKVQPSADSLFWRRFAEAVTRKPLLYALPVVVVMLALGIPFLHATYATPDYRALPDDSKARQVAESLQQDYPYDFSQAIKLATEDHATELKELALEVSEMADVKLVNGPIGRFEKGKAVGEPRPFDANAPNYAYVFTDVAADSERAQQIVRDIRGMITDRQIDVGGPTAILIDSSEAIAAKLPLAVGIIAVTTFILLFLFTGSVVVPIKALALNMLVLSAVLGMMVWVFQYGHGASLLGVTPAPLNLSMVVLLCTIAFSLSIDYEIFLLSRIKEARDSGMTNNTAIVVGLGRVGRIISSAALLLTITLVSFASGLSFMKMFGIGTALAVVIDATIIRGVVVPAFLRLAGDWNWWAPAPLRKLHDKIGISEGPSAAHAPAPEIDPELVRQLDRVAGERTLNHQRVLSPPREVEVVPGRHLVANVNGTVIVVAHREMTKLTQHSAAAQQLSALSDMVRNTEAETLTNAFSELVRRTHFSRQLIDVGIVLPTKTGLELLLSGNVTIVLDDGVFQTVMRGRGNLMHKSVPVPAVAVVVTVDDADQPHFTPSERNGVYSLTDGTVPGQGAIVWCQPGASGSPSAPARGQAPAAQAVPFVPPARSPQAAPIAPPARPPAFPDRRAPAPAAAPAPTKRWVLLDDHSSIELERDCVLGRDPRASDAVVKGGLRPVLIEDVTEQLSRAHLEVRIVNGEVVITDRQATNGSFIRNPVDPGWSRLEPWVPTTWRPGASVRIGGRTLVLHVSNARGSQGQTPQALMNPPHPQRQAGVPRT